MADNDLAFLLSSKFTITKDENTTDSPHPRLADFKEKPLAAGDQIQRRIEFLQRQKQKRFDAQNYARKLASGFLDDEDFDEIRMEVADEKPKDAKKTRKRYQYRDQLMLSEWIIDAPIDLHSHWTMVLCPPGKRVLIVAHKGKTMMFGKNGYIHRKFPSLLPGGNRFNTSHGFQSTILDCIFDEGSNTLYILDMMCFKGYPLYDCQTTFRFYWIKAKLFEENDHNIMEISQYNKFKFTPCLNVPCTEDQIVKTVTSMHDFQVDGLLFYHNDSHYIPGRTPLVGWLKTCMLPNILGIELPESFTDTASPKNGDCIREVLKKANKDLQHTSSDKSIYKETKQTTDSTRVSDATMSEEAVVTPSENQSKVNRVVTLASDTMES